MASRFSSTATADSYTLGTAASLATLFSNALTGTLSPAVTLRSVGPNGGEAAAFTFDFGRLGGLYAPRQPARSGRSATMLRNYPLDDLFYGAASFDPQPDWVDLNNVSFPKRTNNSDC